MRSKGFLVEKTGISPNNYKWWQSKRACDSWFQDKKKAGSDFTEISVIRPDGISKNGFNVAAVHLQMPYDDTILCDYVSFQMDSNSRFFHCQVIDREYVNEKSTRIYFVIDYVATFYDTLILGECFIERTHVTDDWYLENAISAHKYLLPEPFSVEIRHRPELVGDEWDNDLKDVNTHLTLARSCYNMVSAVDKDGAINNPEMVFQAGGCINGYVYDQAGYDAQEGDGEFINLTKKYVTYMSKVLNKSSSLSESINAVYMTPLLIASNRESIPVKVECSVSFGYLLPFIVKHAKTMDYKRLRVVGNSGSVILSEAEHADENGEVKLSAWFSGSPNGNCTLVVHDKKGEPIGTYIGTNNWPQVAISGQFTQNNFSVNTPQIQGTSLEDLNRYLYYHWGGGAEKALAPTPR